MCSQLPCHILGKRTVVPSLSFRLPSRAAASGSTWLRVSYAGGPDPPPLTFFPAVRADDGSVELSRSGNAAFWLQLFRAFGSGFASPRASFPPKLFLEKPWPFPNVWSARVGLANVGSCRGATSRCHNDLRGPPGPSVRPCLMPHPREQDRAQITDRPVV